ncbi:hypothetical protein [Mucilaginibacter sp. UR6-11]|uniref:hypothetical protein n=1 Tax=Mucilaginibacter sp. UR6-11 TaxID=1435644 RepID=UPI001E2AD1DE|nr:hypothetical protein [Mucilaginibacter sp. UR6-11]
MFLLSFNPYACLRCFLMVLASITGTFTYGQSTYGIVSSNLKPLSGATIKNLSSGRLAVSGMEGNFVLTLTRGDTILTSYIGLKTDTLIFHNQSPLLISLKPLPNTLGEITIRDHQVSALDKFRKNRQDYKQIYRIGDDSHIISALGGFAFAGIAINIDALYSHFSREGKNARRLQKTLVRDYHDDIIDTRFTRSLVTKYTGYEGQQLDNFMIDNRPTYEFITHASEYDIIKYIQQQANKNTTPKDTTIIVQK